MANARKKKGARATPRGRAPEPDAQPGKRPSNPAFLLLLALVWIACGVYAIAALSASWKFVPGIFFIGVGILFLRGAAQTVVRRSERS
ncbi:MAG: hypothetical protein JOZ68_09525 [Acidimicrobiia bacterium]|nr:hypothetical protein [Acidimicrobiia bacterium]MBV9041235.1 hypothetical protein [Acidimicrobiia bacterium]